MPSFQSYVPLKLLYKRISPSFCFCILETGRNNCFLNFQPTKIFASTLLRPRRRRKNVNNLAPWKILWLKHLCIHKCVSQGAVGWNKDASLFITPYNPMPGAATSTLRQPGSSVVGGVRLVTALKARVDNVIGSTMKYGLRGRIANIIRGGGGSAQILQPPLDDFRTPPTPIDAFCLSARYPTWKGFIGTISSPFPICKTLLWKVPS